MAEAMQRAAFDLHRLILETAIVDRALLPRADATLQRLRVYVRLSREFELMGSTQYEHASRLLDEIGRLLGGWKKASASRAERGAGRQIADSREQRRRPPEYRTPPRPAMRGAGAHLSLIPVSVCSVANR